MFEFAKYVEINRLVRFKNDVRCDNGYQFEQIDMGSTAIIAQPVFDVDPIPNDGDIIPVGYGSEIEVIMEDVTGASDESLKRGSVWYAKASDLEQVGGMAEDYYLVQYGQTVRTIADSYSDEDSEMIPRGTLVEVEMVALPRGNATRFECDKRMVVCLREHELIKTIITCILPDNTEWGFSANELDLRILKPLK